MQPGKATVQRFGPRVGCGPRAARRRSPAWPQCSASRRRSSSSRYSQPRAPFPVLSTVAAVLFKQAQRALRCLAPAGTGSVRCVGHARTSRCTRSSRMIRRRCVLCCCMCMLARGKQVGGGLGSTVQRCASRTAGSDIRAAGSTLSTPFYVSTPEYPSAPC